MATYSDFNLCVSLPHIILKHLIQMKLKFTLKTHMIPSSMIKTKLESAWTPTVQKRQFLKGVDRV